jgi:cytidyltransferase-like protein
MKKRTKKIKKKSAFVTMCADGFHHGHINILEKAKKYGKVIVGLMTDSAILTYKKKKPVIKFKHRKKILSYINVISKIIPVKSLNFVEVAKKYKFDYWVHGDDWKKGVQAKERIKLIKQMKKWDGKVIDVPYTKGISSSILKDA